MHVVAINVRLSRCSIHPKSKAPTTEPPKALTCEETKSLVTPCLDFLTDKTNTPPTPCCQGLNKLIVSTPTKEEKLAACKCLKEATSRIPNFDVGEVNNLPKVCNINVNYPISKDFDCDK
ncbi:hypothetical protein ACSQ67_016997 [Phaseolus vulgaris]